MSNRLLSSALAATLSVSAGAALVAGATYAPSAQAGEHVTGIQLSELPGLSLDRGAEVFIQAKNKPKYNVFRLENPMRLVVDINGADVASAQLPDAFGEADLVRAVTATQFMGANGQVSRVVVVLRHDAEFHPTTTDDGIHLSLLRRGTEKMTAATPTSSMSDVAPAQNDAMIELNGDGDVQRAHKLSAVRAVDRDGSAFVQLVADGQVERFEVEEVDNPPRLVVDLYGLKGPKALNRRLELPGLKRVRAAEHPTYTRVVVEGTGAELPAYDVASTSEGLQLVFSERKAAAQNIRVSSLKHDVKEGFERVSIAVSDSVAVRTVANAPGKKTIALDGVQLSSDLLGTHRLPGAVASTLEIARDENNPDTVRLTLHSDANVEHSVWQKSGKLMWDVRKRPSAGDRVQPRAAPYAHSVAQTAQSGTAARRYRGRKITIDLMEAEVINVLRLLGDVSGKNIVVGDDVKGKVSIKLKNVPWDQALDVILRTKGFDKEVKGGIIRIAKADVLAKERQARLELAASLREQSPTSVRLIPVNYGVAKELVPQIKELLSEKRGRATYDERTNVIIVEDVRENLEQAQQLVRTLDTQTPQVLIEARMIEAQTQVTRSLGIQWGGNFAMDTQSSNPTGLVFPATVSTMGGASPYSNNLIQAPASHIGTARPLQPGYAVNMPVVDPTTAVGMTLGSIGDIGVLNARISAAEINGDLRVVSAPKVTTLNNKTAKMSQGVQQFFSVQQNALQPAVAQAFDALLTLDVTPHVTADGSVLMDISMTNNTFGSTVVEGQPPPIIMKESKTELLVQDGDTAVIGGIFTRTTRETVTKTPLLGDIPLLGWLFKAKSTNDERNEMLIFVTPRIVTQENSY